MRHPDVWAFGLLCLAAFRVVRIIGWDEITTRLRGRLTLSDHVYGEWIEPLNHLEEQGVDPWVGRPVSPFDPMPFTRRRWYAAKLIRCPWCCGTYVGATIWILWVEFPRGTLVASTPFAIGAVIGLVAKNLDP